MAWGKKWPHPRGHLFYIDSHREKSLGVFAGATGPVKAKFHTEPQWVGGPKVCLQHLSHMTKMATMPIKIFFETKGPMPLGAWYLALGTWAH